MTIDADIEGRILDVADLALTDLTALGHAVRAAQWQPTVERVAAFNNYAGRGDDIPDPDMSVFANYAPPEETPMDQTGPPTDVVRERVARHLHRMLSPRGEDADRDWAEMNRWRRNMYLTEADRVIALVGGEVPDGSP